MYVRMWATYAIGEIGDPTAIGLVETKSNDPDPNVRMQVSKALAKLRRR